MLRLLLSETYLVSKGILFFIEDEKYYLWIQPLYISTIYLLVFSMKENTK